MNTKLKKYNEYNKYKSEKTKFNAQYIDVINFTFKLKFNKIFT